MDDLRSRLLQKRQSAARIRERMIERDHFLKTVIGNRSSPSNDLAPSSPEELSTSPVLKPDGLAQSPDNASSFRVAIQYLQKQQEIAKVQSSKLQLAICSMEQCISLMPRKSDAALARKKLLEDMPAFMRELESIHTQKRIMFEEINYNQMELADMRFLSDSLAERIHAQELRLHSLLKKRKQAIEKGNGDAKEIVEARVEGRPDISSSSLAMDTVTDTPSAPVPETHSQETQTEGNAFASQSGKESFLNFLITENTQKEKQLEEQMAEFQAAQVASQDIHQRLAAAQRELASVKDEVKSTNSQLLKKRSEMYTLNDELKEVLANSRMLKSIPEMEAASSQLQVNLAHLQEQKKELLEELSHTESLIKDRKDALRYASEELELRMSQRERTLMEKTDRQAAILTNLDVQIRMKEAKLAELSQTSQALLSRNADIKQQYQERAQEVQKLLLKESWLKEAVHEKQKKVETMFSRARHGKMEQVENLLHTGLSIDSQDRNGNTLLHTAAQNNRPRIAQLALTHKASLNIQNCQGNTPLHYCFMYGYKELGQKLMELGADVTIQNLKGELPLETKPSVSLTASAGKEQEPLSPSPPTSMSNAPSSSQSFESQGTQGGLDSELSTPRSPWDSVPAQDSVPGLEKVTVPQESDHIEVHDYKSAP